MANDETTQQKSPFPILLILWVVVMAIAVSASLYYEQRHEARATASSVREIYGATLFSDNHSQISYVVDQKVDVAKKLQMEREFDIPSASLSNQIGDVAWLMDIPTLAVMHNELIMNPHPAFKGKYSADAVLNALLWPAGCSKEVVNNEILYVYCKERYTVLAETQEKVQKQLYPPITRKFGDRICARYLVDACVNVVSKQIFIPRGDAEETLKAFVGIQEHLPIHFNAIDFEPTNIARHQTQEVNGVFSADEALTQMLKSSGLTWRGEKDQALIAPAEKLAADVALAVK